jgi:hypothetical protein
LTFLFKTYVDAILFDTTADLPIKSIPLTLESADLHYYGLSSRTSQEEIYDFVYGAQPELPQFNYYSGSYTKYGDVTELLQQTDDRFVIAFGGDEVTLRYSPAPTPETGQQRGFVLYTNGYYKDPTTDLPPTVEPLPFAAMSNYPYDPTVEHYPTDNFHTEYVEQWNTRTYPPTLTIDSLSILEPARSTDTSQLIFKVSLSNAADQDVTVNYRTGPASLHSATDDSGLSPDYFSSAGTLVIQAGSMFGTIAITVLGDDLVEGDEIFYVLLLDPYVATLVSNYGIGTIRDNES